MDPKSVSFYKQIEESNWDWALMKKQTDEEAELHSSMQGHLHTHTHTHTHTI